MRVRPPTRSASRSASTAAAVFVTATNSPTISATAKGASSRPSDVVIYAAQQLHGQRLPARRHRFVQRQRRARGHLAGRRLARDLDGRARMRPPRMTPRSRPESLARQLLGAQRPPRDRLPLAAPRRPDDVAGQRRRRRLLGAVLDAERRRRRRAPSSTTARTVNASASTSRLSARTRRPRPRTASESPASAAQFIDVELNDTSKVEAFIGPGFNASDHAALRLEWESDVRDLDRAGRHLRLGEPAPRPRRSTRLPRPRAPLLGRLHEGRRHGHADHPARSSATGRRCTRRTATPSRSRRTRRRHDHGFEHGLGVSLGVAVGADIVTADNDPEVGAFGVCNGTISGGSATFDDGPQPGLARQRAGERDGHCSARSHSASAALRRAWT